MAPTRAPPAPLPPPRTPGGCVLDRPQFLIGRRTSADLQIVSTDVSREHAEIVQDEGRYLLRDRGSRYGTFVNGEQVTERVLEHGDRIRLGRTDAIELVFATDGAKTTGFLDAFVGRHRPAPDGGHPQRPARAGIGRVLDEVLTLVMDSALDVTKAERGFMMLANTEGELEFKIARGKGKTTLSGRRSRPARRFRARCSGQDRAASLAT